MSVIWSSDLDNGKYDVVVERLNGTTGLLTVVENDSGQEVFSEEVKLSYGATFGPDVADVLEWQQLIEKRIPK